MEETQIPITGLEELESHLNQIADNPDTPLNAKLFDEVELQLTGMHSLTAPMLIIRYIYILSLCGSLVFLVAAEASLKMEHSCRLF